MKDEEQPSDFSSRAGEGDAAKTVTILVVEDEKIIRDLIVLDLREAGAMVAIAADGQEAIDHLEQQRPDLILLDILMPRKDGFAVLRHLRERGVDVPVVVLSNLTAPDQERLCREFGAKDYIIKSDLDTGQLWGRIRKFLHQ